MKKLCIFFGILITTTHIFGHTINLPAGFCEAYEVAQSKRCLLREIKFDSKTPVFLVLIHGTFSSQDKFLSEVTLNTDVVPEGFFAEQSYNGMKPIKLSYNWTGENNDKARIQAGRVLAQGLNEIMQQCGQNGITPKVILMAHSHGGNVVAVASNFVNKPIDCAIFLATPVLRYDEKKKTKTDNDLFLPRGIKQLFLFYSSLDFIQTTGALTEEFKRRYGPLPAIDLYNVHLLLNGQEPSHVAFYNQLIEDHILLLCQKIKTLYKKNRNLVANIAPGNAQVDKLVAIKKYDPVESNPLAGVAVDSLWPNWEQFTFTQNEPDEIAVSEKDRVAFNKFYNKEFIHVAPFLDRAIRGFEQDVCVLALGKLGSVLDSAPADARNGAQKTCCKYSEFTRTHPNAAQALRCSSQPAGSNTTLNPAENRSLCINLLGVPGRTLAYLPDGAKQYIKQNCCFDEFKKTHPNAAAAVGCN